MDARGRGCLCGGPAPAQPRVPEHTARFPAGKVDSPDHRLLLQHMEDQVHGCFCPVALGALDAERGTCSGGGGSSKTTKAAAAAAAAAFPSCTATTPKAPKPLGPASAQTSISTLNISQPPQPDHSLFALRAHHTQHPAVPTPRSSLLQPHHSPFAPPNPHSTLSLHAPPSSTKLAGTATSTLSTSPSLPRTHRRGASRTASPAANPSLGLSMHDHQPQLPSQAHTQIDQRDATISSSSHPPRNTDGGVPRVRPHACKPHRPGSILVPLPACTLAPAPASESLVGSAKPRGGWSGSQTSSSSSTLSAASRRGGQPGAKHAVLGAAGVLLPSRDHPAVARSCPSRPSTANPITHSLMDIPSKASYPQTSSQTPRDLPAWPSCPHSMHAISVGDVGSHTQRPCSRPSISNSSCKGPFLGPSRSMPTSSSSRCNGPILDPSRTVPQHCRGAASPQVGLQQHSTAACEHRGLHDAQMQQHGGHGSGAAAATPALGEGAGTAAATKLPLDAKEPHAAQQQPPTPAPASPLRCWTSTAPSPPQPSPPQQPVPPQPSQPTSIPALAPTAVPTPAPSCTAPLTHGSASSCGPQEQQQQPSEASKSPPRAPPSPPSQLAPSLSSPSCHQATITRGCQERSRTRPTSSASSVWSTLVQAPTALPPPFSEPQPGMQGGSIGRTLDRTNLQAAPSAHKCAASASQMALQESEARQQLVRLQQLRGAGQGGLPSTNCEDSRPDTPWTIQVAKAAGQANDDDATSIDIVSAWSRPGTSTTGSRAFTPVDKPSNNNMQHSASKQESQRGYLAPFVRQAAPMILCVDDPARSSEEVLEMELQRKLRELSLDELRQINALL
mmetsp:Transcript_12388/g.32698  ORF Transcript_12388/g.32698 Transcript_12388/m.32698 type:complete len:844 (+) Transcript_12388:424-2955(+)